MLFTFRGLHYCCWFSLRTFLRGRNSPCLGESQYTRGRWWSCGNSISFPLHSSIDEYDAPLFKLHRDHLRAFCVLPVMGHYRCHQAGDMIGKVRGNSNRGATFSTHVWLEVPHQGQRARGLRSPLRCYVKQHVAKLCRYCGTRRCFCSMSPMFDHVK